MPTPTKEPSATKRDDLDLNALARHMLLELKGCDQHMLNDNDLIKQTLIDAATEAGAHVVETVFHQFSPYGLSGVVVIAESHITIHTWPEYGYAAVDVFTCGAPALADKLSATIGAKFNAERTTVRAVDRGLNLPPAMTVLTDKNQYA